VQAEEFAGRCEAEMTRAAQRNHVPVAVLYAVGLTETGRRGWLDPFAMNIEGRPYFAKNLSDAMREFNTAQQQGRRLIDIGCMQIDHHFHAQHFRTLADMFDPQQNVTYAVKLLQQLQHQEGSWTLAVARYHAGPTKTEEQHRYVCSVVSNMVNSGLGAWTPKAQHYCQRK
jgi:Transglycosylase SLT domain